ncbi:Uncharacterized protein Fot_21823 [Forsythia ovata]|uniref:Uncharacterized protein n=1 Tax=Forsythia ovata TaxID=205694 RepID=A0ABD1UW77_9LAMI
MSIKEDLCTEELITAAFLLKFKELIDEFDSTTDPIDLIRHFQNRVRLHRWQMPLLAGHFSYFSRCNEYTRPRNCLVGNNSETRKVGLSEELHGGFLWVSEVVYWVEVGFFD